MASPHFDKANGILLFTATSQTTVGDTGIPRPLQIESMVLEGAAAASTITDGNGHIIATLATMDFQRMINREVQDLVASTIGLSANVRVYLKKANH